MWLTLSLPPLPPPLLLRLSQTQTTMMAGATWTGLEADSPLFLLILTLLCIYFLSFNSLAILLLVLGLVFIVGVGAVVYFRFGKDSSLKDPFLSNQH